MTDETRTAPLYSPDTPDNGTLWLHTKTNTVYRVYFSGFSEKYLTQMVAYANADNPVLIWIRPLDEFLDGRFAQGFEMVDGVTGD